MGAPRQKEEPLSHSSTVYARATALAVATLVSVPVLAGTATAAPENLNAPYARAAAKLSANGELRAGKNIESSKRVAKGRYCVKVSDPSIDLENAAIVASGNGSIAGPGFNVYGKPLDICGNEPNTITVIVYSGTTEADAPFTVAVL